jgi:hypothetical protein
VESGTHDQLLQRPDGEYKILWEKQSEQSLKEAEEKMKKETEEKEFKKAVSGSSKK